MNDTVKVICPETPGANDISFAKIVEFMGLTHELLPVSEYLRGCSEPGKQVPSGDVLACDLDTLRKLRDTPELYQKFMALLDSGSTHLFVYGATDNESLLVLQDLTDGAVGSVLSPTGEKRTYHVQEGFEDVTRQLTGTAFNLSANDSDRVLKIRDGSWEIDTLITVNDSPLFIRTTRRQCQIFIAAVSEVMDIHRELEKNTKLTEFFPGLIPVIMFLKHVFQDRCWHAASSPGCFVIDDPLLKPSYGYLDYKKLYKLITRNDCHVSVGVIPWNYRRSKQNVVDFFAQNQRYFSLCIHGCDHTGAEFSPVDDTVLEGKTRRALRKMEAHRDNYGLDFDRVMVFPQQVFSTRALLAMKRNNILAATDSGVIPFDYHGKVTIESLLRPAFIDSENFPVIQRRTPRRIVDFALDLFLGKPLIFFEHHDLFTNGYEAFDSFLAQLNALRGGVTWKNLAAVIRESYLQKFDGDGRYHVDLFAQQAVVKNDSDKKRSYTVTKPETGNVPIEAVRVNGKEIEYTLAAGELSFSLDIPPGERAEIDITYINLLASTFREPAVPYTYRIKVFLRRYLSEFRDVYVTKIGFLTRLINSVIRRFTHEYDSDHLNRKSTTKQ